MIIFNVKSNIAVCSLYLFLETSIDLLFSVHLQVFLINLLVKFSFEYVNEKLYMEKSLRILFVVFLLDLCGAVIDTV